MKDPYEILGLQRGATEDEIKKAYRNLARKHHPDVHPDPEDKKKHAEIFKEVNEAFERLTNPQPRQEHPFGRPFSSVFNDFFHHAFNQPETGENIVVRADIELKDVLSDGTISLSVPKKVRCKDCQGRGGELTKCTECDGQGARFFHRGPMVVQATCGSCNGKGQVVGKPCAQCHGGFSSVVAEEVTIQYPKGVRDGDRFAVRGHGHPCANPEGQNGDLYIVVHVKPDARFQVGENGNLLSKEKVTYTQLVLGCELDVETLSGTVVKLSVPKAPDSFRFKIKGYGLPRNRGDGVYTNGDLFVELVLDLPKELSPEYKEIIDRLALMEQERLCKS